FGGGVHRDELWPVPFLRHCRCRRVGIGGDAVVVVDIEPAHIGQCFAAALRWAAGVVVATVVALTELDGFVDDRTGHLPEGAFGEVTAAGLGMEELVVARWLVR